MTTRYPRRKVMRSYKDYHWSALYSVLLDCGHWQTAQHMRGGVCPKTVQCRKCAEEAK
jgi:hypothetical protein